MLPYGKLLCALFLVVFFPTLPGYQAGSPLMSIAKKIVAEASWSYPYYYEWQSDRSVIAWKGGPHSPRANPLPTAFQVDVPSGIQTPLTNFNRRFANLADYLGSKIPGGFVPYFIFLSPDGKWIFWVGGPFAGNGNLGPRWGALSLDGDQQIIWNQIPEIPAYPWGAWMPDSQHWAGLTFDSYASFLVIYSLKVTNAVRKISLPQTLSGSLRLIGFTAHGNAIATRTVGDGISNGELFTFSIDDKMHLTEKHVVHLPKGARIDELVLSQQRDRLAWCLNYYHDMPNSKEFSFRTEVWVSNLNSSRFHEIGFYEKKYTYTNSKERDYVKGIQWLPNGKQLSFIYQNALWTVPAD